MYVLPIFTQLILTSIKLKNFENNNRCRRGGRNCVELALEFYASSVELSEDGKMGRIYRQPKANMAIWERCAKRKKKQAKVKGTV
jgi:hypothetical protein